MNLKNGNTSNKGFTLIELVVVIGILSILLAIVLIAINPARQFKQANDTKRRSDVGALINAIGQYAAENKGKLPSDINTTVKHIASAATGADLCGTTNGQTDKVSPTYISALPQDPLSNNGAPITDCTGYDTGYTVVVDSNGRVTVSAPSTEIPPTISVTR